MKRKASRDPYVYVYDRPCFGCPFTPTSIVSPDRLKLIYEERRPVCLVCLHRFEACDVEILRQLLHLSSQQRDGLPHFR